MLEDFATEVVDRNLRLDVQGRVFGVEKGAGLTETRYQSKDLSRYKKIRVGWFAYNPMRLNIGSIGMCKAEDGDGLVSPDYVVFKLDERVDPNYFDYYTRTQRWREWVERAGRGSVRTRIYFKNLAEMDIDIPELQVQKDATSVLRALDDRIDNLRAANITLETIVQALFKSWFVDFDPAHAKAEGRAPEGMDAATAALFPSEFEDSELRAVPKGWRVSTLGAFCEAHGGAIQTGPFGSQLHASDYVADGVAVVMPQDLVGRRIVEDRIARTSSENAERLARHKLRPGDIVFSRRGDVGRHAVVTARQANWLCGTGCLLVRPAERNPSTSFVSGALARPQSLDWLQRHAVGATMPNLNTKILAALPLIIPSDAVLVAFEQIAGALERRASANDEQAVVLAVIRDTLLPRLISGKLRLPEARELAESEA